MTKRYRVPFENASGSVWVEAESAEDAVGKAGEVLLDGIAGVLQVDVSAIAGAPEVSA